MPYAAKAKVEHEFDTDHLNLWLTFRHKMRRTAHPLDTPPIYDIMPPLISWSLKADSVPVLILSSQWLDEFTLELVSDYVASLPDRVTLAYLGPYPDLATKWRKQWEPWGPILSLDITT